ncbi:unnamed protein product [Gemmata massiliana]|uniref:Uncharacterized protein n=1 Tax=Gemmata massiliana TaxID=1210884 RepID=A0A6P2CP66_9BACT|nr:hypothetical protein [Gemmata massiliana]VTR90808.1 unnamed protein product [Gemmata massiliana]
MKFALLSLVTAGALTMSAGSANARPPRYYGGYNGGYYSRPVVVYPSINTSPYVYPAGGFYNYGSGFNLNVGGIGLSVGSGVYPSYGYNYGSYYSRPYYNRGWNGFGYRRW